MNKKEKKRLIGLIGIVLVILGLTGVIPSSLNNLVFLLGGFGALVIIGIIMAIYGFVD